jgi:glycosyltransferase involved in cell wall biosynthesis
MSTTIAVLIPCYNEATTVAAVVKNFRSALPNSVVYVYDNASTDNTIIEARKAGAVVRQEVNRGKGSVVRRMFADIDADVFIMVDGDDTYDATAAPSMVDKLLTEGLDMVSAVRIETERAAYRTGHRFGNWLLTTMTARIFGRASRDMLSGYRVMSRRFVKSFPVMSVGFEIETELTVHALQMRLPVGEVETPYSSRPEGSQSKLNTVRDGIRILWTIGYLMKEEKPLEFFALVGALLAALSLLLGGPVVFDYLRTGLVPRLPTAVAAASLMLGGMLALSCGLILQTVTRGRLEAKRLVYLTIPFPFRSDSAHVLSPQSLEAPAHVPSVVQMSRSSPATVCG